MDDQSAQLADTFEARKENKILREEGIQLFNKKPKKGIKFLQEKGMLGSTEKDIAEFLHKEQRLDRTQIGEYLGDPDALHLRVRFVCHCRPL